MQVRRQQLLNDTVLQMRRANRALKRPLKVKFIGEEGVDEGGVTKVGTKGSSLAPDVANRAGSACFGSRPPGCDGHKGQAQQRWECQMVKLHGLPLRSQSIALTVVLIKFSSSNACAGILPDSDGPAAQARLWHVHNRS